MDGFYRIIFSEMDGKSFKWLGEWIDPSGKIRFPTWKIECVKRRPESEKEQILEEVKAFSQAYMNADAPGIASMYTEDAKIFPGNSDIIAGREAIEQRWKFKEGVSELYHKVTPSEIKIIDNYAYDYGYYEGSIKNPDSEKTKFKGKYVIVWRKENDRWKIYLDIWNRI